MDLTQILTAIGPLVAVAGLIITLHVGRQKTMAEAFARFELTLKEHNEKDEVAFEDLRKFNRELGLSISRDYVRYDEFTRNILATKETLVRLETNLQSVANQIVELNRYLRDNAGVRS